MSRAESSADTVQQRFDTGDLRPPSLIRRERRVTSGDIHTMAMCAHRYAPSDLGGWHTHEFDDVRREWITDNVASVIARLSPHCEDTRGDLYPLHWSNPLARGGPDRPTQTTLQEVSEA